MKKTVLTFAAIAAISTAMAQFGQEPKDTTWKTIYRATAPKINDLVHTKLEVKPDFNKVWLYGKATITLHPHFYPTDSLSLDAKGMDIKEVSILKGAVKTPLKYRYDGMMLNINLDKTYYNDQKYTVFIEYISKPDELEVKGSAAITDAKGLYFINPHGTEKNKPTQLWTQGETEANSVWFPTIDKTNQKTTEEIYLTIPSNFVSLSNGLLISQKKNADGTRTDYWKMDLPHCPYLFFIGAGDFAIVKDFYKGKEVSYYVEKKYESVARKIFGETPAMISGYEKLLGVDFPWPKYSQIVGRDYVSGAMENTTATLHQESAYQNARQLVDGNAWEGTIAHELFHQWFGDLVTAESWSNLTLNESFADYSETIWEEIRHGKDAAEAHNYQAMQQYLGSGSDKKDLVRYHYSDKEDMFDAVSYNKGGRILNMLRNYVGDSAFFKSLNKYLTDNKFKSAEAAQLRLAFEEVSGKDLNWFFNQWYYGNGHPKLKIDYVYNPGTTQVIIEQTQKSDKIFNFPLAIDIYNGMTKQRKQVWVTKKIDTFSFATSAKPDLVNVDADRVLLAEKTDSKTAENYIHQWKYATKYLDRYEALNYFSKNKMAELSQGLGDRYDGLREFTLTNLASNKSMLTPTVYKEVLRVAETDPSRTVKARAINILASAEDKTYLPLFRKYVSDSSYSLAGAALDAIKKLNPDEAYTLARQNMTDIKGRLARVVTDLVLANGNEADFDFMSANYTNAAGQAKLTATKSFAEFLEKVKDPAKVKQGVQQILEFRSGIPERFKSFTEASFKSSLTKLAKAKEAQGQKELADYILKEISR